MMLHPTCEMKTGDPTRFPTTLVRRAHSRVRKATRFPIKLRTISEFLQDEFDCTLGQWRSRLVETRELAAVGVIGGDHAERLHLVGELRQQGEDVHRDRRPRCLLAEREGELVIRIEG